MRTLEEIEAKTAELDKAWAKVKRQLVKYTVLMCLFGAAFFCYYQLVFKPPAWKYWLHNLDIYSYKEVLEKYQEEGEEPPAEILAKYEALRNKNPQIVLPGIGLAVLGVLFLASVLILPPRMKARQVRSYYRAMRELRGKLLPVIAGARLTEARLMMVFERISATASVQDRLKKYCPYIVLVLLGLYAITLVYFVSGMTGEVFRQGFDPVIHPLVLFNFGIMFVMAVNLVTCCRFKTKHEAKLEILAWIANEPAEGLDEALSS